MKINRNLLLVAVAALAGAATTLTAATWTSRLAPGASRAPVSAPIGDYVESRTAAVFCGACHYNGELVCTGNDAVMAWNFTGGTYQGVDLAGVRAMAAVTADTNLSLTEDHKSQLVIDTAASDRQVAAVTALIRQKCAQLGRIVEVTRAPISFVHSDKGYTVKGEGFATLDVSYRTDDGCCKQPGNVWYSPLSPTANRMVGFTELVSFTGALTAPWSKDGDDCAFYGNIAF
jgi:hypothetical protein